MCSVLFKCSEVLHKMLKSVNLTLSFQRNFQLLTYSTYCNINILFDSHRDIFHYIWFVYKLDKYTLSNA